MLPARAAAVATDWAMTNKKDIVPPADATADGFTRTELQKLTRALFDTRRAEVDATALMIAEDEGFAALRVLAAQQYRQLCTSSCITRGVLVRCTSVFVPQKERERGRNSYLFSYRVTLHNTQSNTVAVKLLGRHWEILDAHGVCVRMRESARACAREREIRNLAVNTYTLPNRLRVCEIKRDRQR
jgi:hypothetical protein